MSELRGGKYRLLYWSEPGKNGTAALCFLLTLVDNLSGLCWRSVVTSVTSCSIALLTAAQGAYGYVAMGPYDGGQVSVCSGRRG